MQSLAESCTPLKQRYDSCFNLWFEGYLQPALDSAPRNSRPTLSSTEFASPSSSSTTTSLNESEIRAHQGLPAAIARPKVITNWSSAFRSRPFVPAQSTPHQAGTQPEGDDDHQLPPIQESFSRDIEPVDTTGMTRSQIKAAEYERHCGAAWRDYQSCLRKAIAENHNLTTLLEQAREEHPLHSMDGLEGTPWDPNQTTADD